MPPLVWRTALAAHRLGPPGPHAVEIEGGDVLVLSLVSGTHQSLADGHPDGRLMFGGAREGAAHPTHACPGYGTAVDALLGALTALLARPEALHPGAGPLVWRVEGPVPGAFEEMFAAHFELQPQAPDLKALPAPPTGRQGLVLAAGDSWLDGPWGLRPALAAEILRVDRQRRLVQLEDLGLRAKSVRPTRCRVRQYSRRASGQSRGPSGKGSLAVRWG